MEVIYESSVHWSDLLQLGFTQHIQQCQKSYGPCAPSNSTENCNLAGCGCICLSIKIEMIVVCQLSGHEMQTETCGGPCWNCNLFKAHRSSLSCRRMECGCTRLESLNEKFNAELPPFRNVGGTCVLKCASAM